MMGLYNNWGMDYGFGGFFMILFWVLVVLLIVRLFRYGVGHGGCCGGHDMGGHNGSLKKEDEATRILKERYAKGEINKEQFEEMKRNLEK